MHAPSQAASLVAVVALVAGLRAQAGAQEPATAGEKRAPPTHAVTRIVDARTGVAIPGARVDAVLEASCPRPGTWWSSRGIAAEEDGVVRIRVDDLGGHPWLYFSAPGYATRAELTIVPEEQTALEPGVDVELEVLDPDGRPIAGCLVGRIVGCGHTPDAATATTDARGRAVLRSIDPGHHELWPVAAGFVSDYQHLPEWKPGDPPVVLRLERGPVYEGAVVDRGGKPVPRAFVGEKRTHRGPWTQADEQGRFRLLGASGDGALFVVAADGKEPPLGVFEQAGERALRLVVDAPRR